MSDAAGSNLWSRSGSRVIAGLLLVMPSLAVAQTMDDFLKFTHKLVISRNLGLRSGHLGCVTMHVDDPKVMERCGITDAEMLGAIDYLATLSESTPWSDANCHPIGRGDRYECSYRGASEIFSR